MEQDREGLEQRIWNYWNTTILVIPVRGATRRGCGIYGSFKTQHLAWQETTPSPVFQHWRMATAIAARDWWGTTNMLWQGGARTKGQIPGWVPSPNKSLQHRFPLRQGWMTWDWNGQAGNPAPLKNTKAKWQSTLWKSARWSEFSTTYYPTRYITETNQPRSRQHEQKWVNSQSYRKVWGNIRKKEHEKLANYQRLREELVKIWEIKATVVPVVIGTLGLWPTNWESGSSRFQVQHLLKSLSSRVRS